MRKISRLTAVSAAIVLSITLTVSPLQAAETNGVTQETAAAEASAPETADELITEEDTADETEDNMADTGSGDIRGDAEQSNQNAAPGESADQGGQDTTEEPGDTSAMEEESEDVSGMEEEPEEPLDMLETEEAAQVLDASGSYLVNFNVDNNSSTFVKYTEYSTGKSGYINGYYGADAAYLGSSGNDYIFMMAGVVGKVSASDVALVALSEAQSHSYYYVSGGYLYHRLTRNLSASTYISNLNNGTAPSYLSEGKTYYSYDGHYFYTDYAAMISDYTGDVRSHSLNPDHPYYNYYQFLPLRSETSYTAADLNQAINSKLTSTSKMKDIGSELITRQNTYGVNALLTAAIAANESAWGSSTICLTKNNLFGLGAVDATPGESANYFSSISACLKDFAETYMSKQYLNPGNWKYAGGYLGNKASGINVQYASDPYWGEKAANIAYFLENSLSVKDSYRYVIGIKNPISGINTAPTNGLAVRSSYSSSSQKLYAAPTLYSVAFLVKDGGQTSNGFYKIQSDPVLNSQRTAINTSSGLYSFDAMYAYVASSYITIVSQAQSGVLKAGDGNWYYYENGSINYNYTGVEKNENGWWRIENGKVNFGFTGFAENSNGWWYLEGGKVQFGVNDVIKGTVNQTTGWWYVRGGQVVFTNTVAKNSNGWWYIKNGMVDFSHDGVEKNENGWWRIENGEVNFGFTGFAENSNGWWYLTGGKVQFDTNDVIRGTVKETPGWWYVRGGQVLFTNTVAKNSNGWWYISNGMVDFSHDGVEKNDYGWWCIESGKVNFDFHGFAENSNGWWYLTGGKVQFDTNDVIKGTVKETPGWWYVSGGKVTFTDTVAKNSNGWWYISNGMVDFSHYGVEKNSNGWWRIEAGKVNFDFNGFAENVNGWWYLTGGKVQFDTNDVIKGTVKETEGWWYVVNGKVDLTYSGTVTVNGKSYIVTNGKVNMVN